MNHRDFFSGKKITVMGLGLLGRGIGDTQFLSECGAELIVTDLKSEAELSFALEQLRGYENITYVLGEHRLEDFEGRDMILKAAGVPLDSEYIEHAKAHTIPVEMSASLVARLTDATVIGVTGTRGKTTVTQLIYHILNSADRDVHLAGNVRGIGTLSVLEETNAKSFIVMELDSWQLQGFGSTHTSPQYAVFTTFYPDHMAYYKNDMQQYFDDKANIFRNQRSRDVFVTTEQAKSAISRYSNIEPDTNVVATPYATKNPSLVGEHNKLNAGCAVAIAQALEISDDVIASAIESFPGVEGRLQYVREVDGVKIYNDNNATSPDATIAALEALGEAGEKNIVLIMGGFDKNLDMSKLVEILPDHCKAVVLFKETGTDRIRDDVYALEGVGVFEAEGLPETIEKAMTLTSEGDTLLYSPAFSSFGKYFKNEYDRNDQFLSIIEKL